MPMKPSRIVLSSSSPNGPCLSYYSTRCPKLPSRPVLLYFAGADRHAATTVERPSLPRTAHLTASLVVVLLAASTLWTGTQLAEAGSTTRFEPGTCPITPEPIPPRRTPRGRLLAVPGSRPTPSGGPIRLPGAIIPAASESPPPDPIVFMTGGPGAAAILDIPMLIDAGVNRDRDLIIMSQRGT